MVAAAIWKKKSKNRYMSATVSSIATQVGTMPH